MPTDEQKRMVARYASFTIKTTGFTRKPLRGVFCCMMGAETPQSVPVYHEGHGRQRKGGEHLTVIFASIGIFAVLGLGTGWLAYRYRKEKKAAASFKIVEVKKRTGEKEDGGL